MLESTAKRDRFLIVAAFACIYLIWGSTYLAIRYAVEAIPPFVVAGTRHVVGGGILYLICWIRGSRPTLQHWHASIILGALFFLVGHGSLHWAEQTVPSGVAAVLVATEPIFIALLLLIKGESTFSWRSGLGIALGSIGVILLFASELRRGAVSAGAFAVIFGTFCWSVGMIYSRRATLHPDTIFSSAMTLCSGGLLLFMAAGVTGEFSSLQVQNITMRSLVSVGYLAVCGSLVAYAAYFFLLRRCAPELVATHTYANPAVAVWLGWVLAGERLPRKTIVATLAVVVAVILLNRGSTRQVNEGEVIFSGQAQDAPSALR